jgi:hypothetical protein
VYQLHGPGHNLGMPAIFLILKNSLSQTFSLAFVVNVQVFILTKQIYKLHTNADEKQQTFTHYLYCSNPYTTRKIYDP